MTDPQSTRTTPADAPVPPEIAAAPRLPSGHGPADHGEVAPTQIERLESIHGEFAAFHQGYGWNAITLADTKAVWAFTVCGGVLAYLVAQSSVRALLIVLPWSSTAYVCAASLGLLALATFFAFLVIVPRLGAAPRGLVYFGSVAERPDAGTFIADVSRASATDLTRARLTHAYDLSKIADRKYRRLRISMWLGLIGLAVAAGAILQGATAEVRPPQSLALPERPAHAALPLPSTPRSVASPERPVPS